MIAASPLAILEAALRWSAQGDVVLVTLVGIEGTSSRALGAQMAITGGGQAIGSFSGGCIEAAIIAEAQDVLAKGAGRIVRYGLGSPYIDVRLPCGGGIDLLFTPRPDAGVLGEALARLGARDAVRLVVGAEGVAWDGAGFALALYPPLRMLAFGQGEDLTGFARLASRFGALVEAYSPDASDGVVIGGEAAFHHLASAGRLPGFAGDPWSALVFLFHDRDWEEALLPAALAQPGFYHGAIGSRRTHALRMERLRAHGCDEALLARLQGHIGLIPATRDPASLALSVLAQVVAAYPVAVSGA